MYVREQKARKEGKTPLEWADARVDAVKKYYTSSDGEVLKNNLYLKMYAPMAYDYGCYMFASFNVCGNYSETLIYFILTKMQNTFYSFFYTNIFLIT